MGAFLYEDRPESLPSSLLNFLLLLFFFLLEYDPESISNSDGFEFEYEGPYRQTISRLCAAKLNFEVDIPILQDRFDD